MGRHDLRAHPDDRDGLTETQHWPGATPPPQPTTPAHRPQHRAPRHARQERSRRP